MAANIGGATPLNLQTKNLSAVISGTAGGNINLLNSGAVTLGNITTADGNITIVGNSIDRLTAGAENVILNAPGGSIFSTVSTASPNNPNAIVQLQNSSAAHGFDIISSSAFTGQLELNEVSANGGQLNVSMPQGSLLLNGSNYGSTGVSGMSRV
jgi:hypothetical protein